MFLGDWRSREAIRAERNSNAALQLQYDNYEHMKQQVNPMLEQRMTADSPYYQGQRVNINADYANTGVIGGNMMSRQLGQNGIAPNSTGFNSALRSYYSRLGQDNSANLMALQQAEEERKYRAMLDYMNANQGGQNALQQRQYGNSSPFDKVLDLAKTGAMLFTGGAAGAGAVATAGMSGAGSGLNNYYIKKWADKTLTMPDWLG